MTVKTNKLAKSKITLVFALLILVLVGCDKSYLFDEYRSVKNLEWHQDSIQVFSAKVNKKVASSNWNIHVRNKGNYPYQNLWLFLNVETPKGDAWTDTLEIQLANEEGRWYGSGIGDLYDKTYSYKTNVALNDTGTYVIKIKQGMRSEDTDNILHGIHDIGFQILGVENSNQ